MHFKSILEEIRIVTFCLSLRFSNFVYKKKFPFLKLTWLHFIVFMPFCFCFVNNLLFVDFWSFWRIKILKQNWHDIYNVYWNTGGAHDALLLRLYYLSKSCIMSNILNNKIHVQCVISRSNALLFMLNFFFLKT